MISNNNDNKASSRRGFLQKIGVLSLLPFVDFQLASADEKSVLLEKRLKILTCNIRVDLLEDEQKGLGWKDRREACIQIIKSKKADVVSFQEVLRSQFLDLKSSLSGYYAFGFDGPEMDVRQVGYHGIAKNPIFFSKKRFELLNAGGYWLSETPLEVGSISWGSARARNLSWVRLLDKKTNKELRIINLHLDHVKEEARVEQVKMVLKEASQYQNEFVQILTGDFNAAPNSAVINEVLSSGWSDSFDVSAAQGVTGGTTHAFMPHDAERAKRAKKIDYIFTKGPISAISSTIIKDSYRGVYPSDHYFLEAILEY